jgi:hypothetical protein
MYLKYILIGLIQGFLTILGWFIYPLIYIWFDGIYYGKEKLFWYFINSDEPTFKQNKYGADWWREEKNIRLNRWWKKFFASYRWNAIRNPIYNFKLYGIVPQKGFPNNIKIHYNTTEHGGMSFCDKHIVGKQFATYEIKGQRQFRLSATIKLLWWVQNYQFGMNEKRYVYKMRFWNK